MPIRFFSRGVAVAPVILVIPTPLVERLEDRAYEGLGPPSAGIENAFTSAIKKKVVPTVSVVPSSEPASIYTILDALKDFEDMNPVYRGQTLTLVSMNSVCSYVVKSWDSTTRRALLQGGFKGGVLKPVITEREVPLYAPVWM